MKVSRKLIVVVAVVLLLTSVLWFPAIALAVTDNYDKFEYYLKALEYGLKGLQEYFKFIIELYKISIGMS